ncbi:MAG: hypothetical protein AB7O45_11630, partial [Alphaproteobacteria bacterium]
GEEPVDYLHPMLKSILEETYGVIIYQEQVIQIARVMGGYTLGSPIIAPTPIEGLYLNGGWCYGGFKATPGSGWCFAHTIATGRPHALNAAFTIDRFRDGRVIDERGAGPAPWYQ